MIQKDPHITEESRKLKKRLKVAYNLHISYKALGDAMGANFPRQTGSQVIKKRLSKTNFQIAKIKIINKALDLLGIPKTSEGG